MYLNICTPQIMNHFIILYGFLVFLSIRNQIELDFLQGFSFFKNADLGFSFLTVSSTLRLWILLLYCLCLIVSHLAILYAFVSFMCVNYLCVYKNRISLSFCDRIVLCAFSSVMASFSHTISHILTFILMLYRLTKSPLYLA